MKLEMRFIERSAYIGSVERRGVKTLTKPTFTGKLGIIINALLDVTVNARNILGRERNENTPAANIHETKRSNFHGKLEAATCN